MSKINGDKKRENVKHKRKVKMRLKIAALKQAHLDKQKSAGK
jgi:hypothetical protein